MIGGEGGGSIHNKKRPPFGDLCLSYGGEGGIVSGPSLDPRPAGALRATNSAILQNCRTLFSGSNPSTLDIYKNHLFKMALVNIWRRGGIASRIPALSPLGRRYATSKIAPGNFVEPWVLIITSSTHNKKRPPFGDLCLLYGGEGGIRTLDTLLTYTHFPGVLLQPLGHPSKLFVM